jgi:Terminase large subunit, T4likevirus-type, N-terminal
MPATLSQPTSRMRHLNSSAIFEDLAYEPHDGQLLVHRSRALRRVVASGTRFGKSTAAAMEACVGLLEPSPATLAWVVAPSYELTKRIWTRVVHAFQDKLPHRVLEVIPREHRLLVVNLAGGIAELRAKSADQPAGLLGEGLDFVIVDEAAALRDDTWTSYIVPRLVDRRGWSLVVGTPKGRGWFYDEYKRGQKNRDPDCESWSLPTWTNPHVSAEVIEAEKKRLAAEIFDQQFGAKFIGVPKEPCEQCGGPQEGVVGSITAREGYGEEDDSFLARCPACGMFVDENGRCIVEKVNRWAARFDIDRPWMDSATLYSWHALEEHDWH